MNKGQFKDLVYQQFSRIGKVLSSPKRLELLDLLSQGPKSVELLADETNMSVANTSKHLQALLEARLVTFHKDKNFVIYQLSDQSVVELFMMIRSVAEKQLAELTLLRNEYMLDPKKLESISLDEFIKRYDAGGLTVIDVRPREEYEAGHIEGAISMPIDEFIPDSYELPSDREIVVYCRGPYCLFAAEAVELLQTKGFKAIRLEAGLNEWRMARNHHM